MKIIHIETLLSVGDFARSKTWAIAREQMHEAVAKVVWPLGNDKFVIFPESGKRRGEGNGVKPIKLGMVQHLKTHGWFDESNYPAHLTNVPKSHGDFDAVLPLDGRLVVMEWETGNISSSHRAINKMALGLLKGYLCGAALVVPSRELYQYLTDRIGNYRELIPYLDLWKSIPIAEGVLEIIVMEHDATSTDVPRIPKGTDGRAVN